MQVLQAINGNNYGRTKTFRELPRGLSFTAELVRENELLYEFAVEDSKQIVFNLIGKLCQSKAR